MNPTLLCDRLAEVAEDVYRAITRLRITDAEQLMLEALWIRLDDLVEQIPDALHQAATQNAEEKE